MPNPPRPSIRDAAERIRGLSESWATTTVNERGGFQTWLIRFCEALGVEPPDPPTESYRFELPIRMVDREGRESTNFIDCWKAGHFALEAKASAGAADGRDDLLLRKAFGQVRNYVAHVPGDAPPYLMVVDVPRTLIVWDRWSGQYGDFAAGRRMALATLHERPDDIALLYDIFQQPAVRDPRGRAQAVTKEIAAGLGELAAELEGRGLDTERVARFLMRCVFSCFAEDVGLLPDKLFRETLERSRASGDASILERALTSLWQTMDTGGMYGPQLLHRFNGHFFKTVEALPLERRDVELLIDAAKHDWSKVEPSIFGTLLVRALDPEERHRLGAEYTPRAYIERIVEPTVVEPIRERWTAVQAAVLQLEESEARKNAQKAGEPKVYRSRGRAKKPAPLSSTIANAIELLQEFHTWIRRLSFLDPACGSGNFLYVTMIAVKRIELEVLNEIQRLSREQGGLVLDEVHPRQFHGIEVKPWAREIAELTLWIGYHQFWRETHGGRTPPDPILEDTGTIECRDAVLAWDEIVHRPERDRQDPTPRVRHPVTGELVPDPNATLPYYEYVGARQADWPRADFIVGNPPYIGNKRMKSALGDGYVDSLRAAYPKIPATADFVMYWWYRSAEAIAHTGTVAAALITTNSIVQPFNRPVIRWARALGVGVRWTISDHPWNDEVDGADVRVAMTVLSLRPNLAVRIEVDSAGIQTAQFVAPALNDDLTLHADVPGAASVGLLAMQGIAAQGLIFGNAGFVLEVDEAATILNDARNADVVRRYVAGRDLTARPRVQYVIDFGTRTETEAREYPVAFDIVRDRVFPERAANQRAIRARYWWRFVEPNPNLRSLVAGLTRYIATSEVAKHRTFQFVDGNIAPGSGLIVVGDDSGMTLGVLSASIHLIWALAAGGRLGIGNDPRYARALCFTPFPFPTPGNTLRSKISDLAERLDSHRKAAIARDERVTMTGIYNIIEKLRSDKELTPKERAVHEAAACGVIRDLHNELDALVAEAYGWPWPLDKEEILSRLVALHDERVEEEKRGMVRWLRPEYQIPRFAAAVPESALDLQASLPASGEDAQKPLPWPGSAVEQLAAIGMLVSQRPLSADEISRCFVGARRDLVDRHLDTLALMGEVVLDAARRFQAARKVA